MIIPYEKIPEAFGQLCEDVAIVKKFLEQYLDTPIPEPDQWLDINELVAYDPEKRSKATFYGYTARKEIPFHKNGKKLIFLKSEINQWLKQGRQKTNAEISAEADTYLKRRGVK